MTNVLSFAVVRRDKEGATVITPCVDGVALTNLAEQFEQNLNMIDPTGGYGGLIPEFFRFGPLDRYFWGEAETPFFESKPGRIFVLGCQCGEVGCWPLTTKVSAHGSEVT
jgi:hypothetical protein